MELPSDLCISLVALTYQKIDPIDSWQSADGKVHRPPEVGYAHPNENVLYYPSVTRTATLFDLQVRILQEKKSHPEERVADSSQPSITCATRLRRCPRIRLVAPLPGLWPTKNRLLRLHPVVKRETVHPPGHGHQWELSRTGNFYLDYMETW
jgi:hypothetical protein